ncbi:unnamed protein product, partial [Polarella glacialis]
VVRSAPGTGHLRRCDGTHARIFWQASHTRSCFIAATAAAAAGVSTRRHCRNAARPPVQRRAANTVAIEVATSADLPEAAAVAVRSLRWTKEWLDKPDFSDDDYAKLASNEIQAYRELYLGGNGG